MSDNIDFSYASKIEHNFAQRLIIKTIERVTGKKKLEMLYNQYSTIIGLTIILKSSEVFFSYFEAKSLSKFIVISQSLGLIVSFILRKALF